MARLVTSLSKDIESKKNCFQLISSLLADLGEIESSASQAKVRLRVLMGIHYCCYCWSGTSSTFTVSLKVTRSTANPVVGLVGLGVTRVSSFAFVTPSSCFASKFTEHSVCRYPCFRWLKDLSDFAQFLAWVPHVAYVSFPALSAVIELRPFSTLRKNEQKILLTCWRLIDVQVLITVFMDICI